MTRLNDAQQRLQAALERLETASNARQRAVSPETATEIEVLRSRCETLEDQARAVSSRLDGAIGKIKSVLEA